MRFSVSADVESEIKSISAADNDTEFCPINGFPLSPRFKVFPGFVDVHVHLREPGFFYKESVRTGSEAAAHGGFTDVCAMPNLNPVPDSLENLEPELETIRRNAVINIHPYGSVTRREEGKELSKFSELASYVVAFSDDGVGVQSEDIMLKAMEKARSVGKIIAAHCECGKPAGFIHDGIYAKMHGIPGVGSESEWRMVERDLRLAEKTGCKYHVCHVSARESVSLIKDAKKRGVDVTCETAPHYLCFCDNDLNDNGNFKMNPPIRSEEDKEALICALADGTIDMIATDHAPHSLSEKTGGLRGARNGVVGLETAFPALYTYLVKPGIISLDRLIEAMAVAPRRRFGIPWNNDYCIWNTDEEYEVNPERFYSKGRSTPFAGRKVFGKCVALICGGKTVWQENSTGN